jgi:hypothetical protein
MLRLMCDLTQGSCVLYYRCGVVERVARGGGGRQAVCRGMFKKETDLSVFTGMQVILSAGWHRLNRGWCSADLNCTAFLLEQQGAILRDGSLPGACCCMPWHHMMSQLCACRW